MENIGGTTKWVIKTTSYHGCDAIMHFPLPEVCTFIKNAMKIIPPIWYRLPEFGPLAHGLSWISVMDGGLINFTFFRECSISTCSYSLLQLLASFKLSLDKKNISLYTVSNTSSCSPILNIPPIMGSIPGDN